MITTIVAALLVVTLAAPALIGLLALATGRVPEKLAGGAAVLQSVLVAGGVATLVLAYLRQDAPVVEVAFPPLLVHADYSWRPTFLVDRLSLSYAALVSVVYPTVVRFSLDQMHREPGATRYWLLVTSFAAGLMLISLSGNVDVLYVGWELVGTCSVMLIGFFVGQARAAHNALRALVYYRIGDAALLGAAAWMHHAFPAAEFSHFGEDSTVATAKIVAAALLLATLAKSAQLPLSPWLHRAMEGPAASSAIFYGALSVHLGPFLLLRTAGLWLPFPGIRWAMAAIGLATALYASTVGRTRPDAKTALAYATMTQLGFVFVEVAAGLHTLALVHVWANAGLRTWQFLRSSSLIQDLQDNPLVGADLRLQRRTAWARLLPAGAQRTIYLAALRQFWLDALQWRFVAAPVLAVFEGLARLEDRLWGPVLPPKEGP